MPKEHMEIWGLTVRWYPHEIRDSAHPGGHVFWFASPPSRGDFLRLCRESYPWTSVWEDNLLSIVETEKCDWPMVDWMHKAASVNILDESGRKIGGLAVSRDFVAPASGYDRHAIAVTADMSNRALKGVPKARRNDACVALIHSENRIKEDTVANCEYHQEPKIIARMRKILEDRGFLGKGSRSKKGAKP